MAHGDLGVGSPMASMPVPRTARDERGEHHPVALGQHATGRSTPRRPTPGGFVQITYDALGKKVGVYVLPARMTSDQTLGTTTERVTLTVT